MIMLKETHEKIIRKLKRKSRIIYAMLVLLLAFSVLYHWVGNVTNNLIQESYQIVRQHMMDRQARYMLLEILRNKPLSAGQALDIADVVIDESRTSKVPVHMILGIMDLESEFSPYAVSSEDARGLMQVTPTIWRLYAPEDKLNWRSAVHDPALNVRVGIKYLGDLLKEYKDWKRVLKVYGGFVKSSPDTYIRIVIARAEQYRALLGDR